MDTITVTKREQTGKIGAKKVRKAGLVPATLYHRGDKSINVAVDERELRRILRQHGDTGLVNLKYEGQGLPTEAQQAIYKDVQLDTFHQKLVHLDLLSVRAGEKVVINVPIRLLGTPVGVTEQAGTLVRQLEELTVRCIPKDIPEYVELEVGHLNVRDTLTAGDIALSEGVELYHTELNATICTITEQRKIVVEETEEDVEGEEGVEGEAAEGAEGAAPAADAAAAPGKDKK